VNSTIEIKKNNDNFKDYNLLMRTWWLSNKRYGFKFQNLIRVIDRDNPRFEREKTSNAGNRNIFKFDENIGCLFND
jgi:hypothetical protein